MSEDKADEIERRDECLVVLAGRNRRGRQEAAQELAVMARVDHELILEVADELIDALEFPEAQTRWECLDALSEIALDGPEAVAGAFEGAEDALFDERATSVRLAAFRFLTRYGLLGIEESRRAWPLLSEAIQCYHGGPEYRDMLICLMEFARGDIAPDVGDALVDRVKFDAENGSGFYRAYSSDICSLFAKA